MGFRVLLGSIFLVTVTACSGPKLIGRPDLEIVNAADLPAPTREDLILQQRPYVIGPFDKVAIDIFGVPELSRTIQVDANGQISMPLIGNVDAAGNSPSQLAGLIADKLRGLVRNPQVTVNTDTVNQTVTVDGEVRKPGLYPVTGRMTLLRVAATAGGLSEFARQNFVVVFRRVGAKDMAALYDVRAIRQGLYPDPEIYANDLVYVGENPTARVFKDVLQSGALLSAPLVAVLN